MLTLKILGGVAALLLGVWLGLGTNRQTAEDMDLELALGKGRPRKVKRHFMWLNYLKADKRASERRARSTSTRGRFRTAVSSRDDDSGPSTG